MMKLAEQQFAVKIERYEGVFTSPADRRCLGHDGSVADSCSLTRDENCVDARVLSRNLTSSAGTSLAAPSIAWLALSNKRKPFDSLRMVPSTALYR